VTPVDADLLADPAFLADLAGLNGALIDSLTAAGVTPQITGNPFYRHMQGESPLTARFMTRNAQKRARLVALARRARSHFEVGVNGGHGILLMMWANPDLRVAGVDLCGTVGAGNPRADIYGPVAMDWLRQRFPGRMRLMRGSSADVLPAYAADPSAEPIDLLRIDGARSLYEADFRALRPLLAPGARVIFDDPGWPQTRATVERLAAEGALIPDADFLPEGGIFAADPVLRLA
jgi:hypothetical protein